MKNTLSIYSVHSETDKGTDIEMFTDSKLEQEYCAKLIRAHGSKESKAMLAAGEDLEEVWFEFQQGCSGNDYYYRHDHQVALPAQLTELIEACQRIWNTDPASMGQDRFIAWAQAIAKRTYTDWEAQ